MLTKLARSYLHIPKQTFSTAVRDQIDYYTVLGIQPGATEEAIRNAYADLTRGLLPQKDTTKFKSINQAFVILTDYRTRDAYDSLLKVRKTNYLSTEQQKRPATMSYLSTRKQSAYFLDIFRTQSLKKKLNIDEFGRYKGGLPQKSGIIRGKSRSQTGNMHRSVQIQEALDHRPEYHNVTPAKAQSFKNFNQDEREQRKIHWPWRTFQVDYQFLKFTNFRRRYWPVAKLLVFLFYIVPTFYFYGQSFIKKSQTQKLIKKAEDKKQALKKAAQVVQADVQAGVLAVAGQVVAPTAEAAKSD